MSSHPREPFSSVCGGLSTIGTVIDARRSPCTSSGTAGKDSQGRLITASNRRSTCARPVSLARAPLPLRSTASEAALFSGMHSPRAWAIGGTISVKSRSLTPKQCVSRKRRRIRQDHNPTANIASPISPTMTGDPPLNKLNVASRWGPQPRPSARIDATMARPLSTQVLSPACGAALDARIACRRAMTRTARATRPLPVALKLAGFPVAMIW